MNNIRSHNNITFGWHFKHHTLLTRTAIKNMRKYISAENKVILEKAVQKPDFDEIGRFANKHFYFGPAEKGAKLSFLDFNDKFNAKYCFNEHLKKASELIKENKVTEAFEQFGRALHFLQDMSVPLHTEKAPFIQKVIEAKMHLSFEQLAQNSQRKMSKQKIKMSESNTSGDFFEIAKNLFTDSVEHSRSMPKISNDRKKDWAVIARQCCERAAENTSKLIDSFIETFL